MSHSITIQPTILSLLPDDLEGKRILDVGIGHGQWGYILRTWKKGHPYIIGVEPYEPYVVHARRVDVYDELHCMTGLQYLEENPDSRADIVLLCEVLEHHQTRAEAWKLLEGLESRVRPGGILILSTPDGPGSGPSTYDGNELSSHPIGFSAGDFASRGYQTRRILREGCSLGHVVGPIAYVWWTLRRRRRPILASIVAWKKARSP
jgi:SAM-dependent methyltransferase